MVHRSKLSRASPCKGTISGSRSEGTAGAARRRAAPLALLLGVALFSCSASPPEAPQAPATQRAFYYWRTVFRLSPLEAESLVRLKIHRIYLRVFDIEWDRATSTARLVGKVALGEGQRVPAGIEIVPVVFLREEVFRHLPETGYAELAAVVWREVQDRAVALAFAPDELQLDCDWTDRTQGAFFSMLRELRRLAVPSAAAPQRIALSATIRLHQIKYRERTGVPPVDRGMLMFYSMGTFTADDSSRAIFDAGAASRYLARVREYPLALDLALPIWSWTLHLRDDRVIDVLQSTDPDELVEVAFLRRTGQDRYMVTDSAFFRGVLLREGDELKAETTGPREVAAAAALISPRLKPVTASTRTVSLFDLSERNLIRHGTPSLDRLFESVR
jgi:hypothetical protein